MRLKDKVAIITGGSRGIGYATADKFLKEGATVILTASSQGSADKAVAQLKEKYPDATVAGISPNLSNLESVRNAFREAASKYGCIDILVNNAGVSESTPFTEYTEETFDKVMDLNVKGVFNATRAASECMIAKGQGVILSTSSMVSIYGQPSGIAYPASKFAVNGLTVSLARELGPKGIRVNAVAPGITLTDMMKAVPKEVIDPLIKQIPLRRLGQPEDIANAFVFLASDEASYITGVVLSVDGMGKNIKKETGQLEMAVLSSKYGGIHMKRIIPILMTLLLLSGCATQSAEKTYRQITMEEAITMMEEETGYIILDVRTAQEYSEKHIPGAINIANESIGTEDISELPDKDQLILVYCRSGNRSKQASEKLVKLGYTNIIEIGGINSWPGETVNGDK